MQSAAATNSNESKPLPWWVYIVFGGVILFVAYCFIALIYGIYCNITGGKDCWEYLEFIPALLGGIGKGAGPRLHNF